MINESVYGAKSTWINCYYQQEDLTEKNKKANFGDDNATLLQGVANNKVSYSEPLDKSLSYCGLGPECALSHIAYVGVDSSWTPAILDVQDRFVTNFGFFEKTTNNSFVAPSPVFDVTELNYITWSNSINFNRNYSPYLEPITKVNPNNLVLLINVKACQSFNTGNIDVDLKTYLTTYKTTHTHIKQVYVRAFFGNIAETSSRSINAEQGATQNRIPLQLAILDEYEHTSKNIKFYMYGFPFMPVFGNFNNSDGFYRDVTNGFGMVAHTENSKEHIKLATIDRYTFECYTEYYDEFESDILKTVACFGLYFTPDTTTAESGALTSSDMYIGLLDENGIGRGNYLKGADTVNAPQNDYTDMTESGYDYTKEVDKSKYQNGTDFHISTTTGSFTRFYALTESQVNDLCGELFRIANDVPSGTSITEYNMKCYLTNNPIDCIISLKKFPCAAPFAIGNETVYLGAKSTNITASKVPLTSWIYYFNFSAANDTSLYPVYGKTFLDYEPYTKCTIVVPFCGSVEIPCSYVYDNGGVTVALMIDFVTGATTAYIMVNGNTIQTVQGNCAIDLPVSGIQSATLDSNINNTVQNYNSTAISSAISVIGGGLTFIAGAASLNPMMMLGGAVAIAGGAIKGELAEQKTNYELQHMQTPFKSVSAASGVLAQGGDYRCKMIITRPKMSPSYNEKIYGKTIGFACLKNGVVSEFTGFTVGDIDLTNINAPMEVKNLIKTAFATGVYL